MCRPQSPPQQLQLPRVTRSSKSRRPSEMVKTFVRKHGLPGVKSRGVRKPTHHATHKLVVPMATMQTRQGRQQAALLAMKPFFTNDDLLSLVINEALPAAGALSLLVPTALRPVYTPCSARWGHMCMSICVR